MRFDQWLELGIKAAPLLAVLIVPLLTYRFALQVEQRKWERERAVDLYLDWLQAVWEYCTNVKDDQRATKLQDAMKMLIPRLKFFSSGIANQLVVDWMEEVQDLDPCTPDFDKATLEHAHKFNFATRTQVGLKPQNRHFDMLLVRMLHKHKWSEAD